MIFALDLPGRTANVAHRKSGRDKVLVWPGYHLQAGGSIPSFAAIAIARIPPASW